MARPPPIDTIHTRPVRPVDPPPVDPILTRASISFHTNDDDKNDDSRVDAFVWVDDQGRKIMVARLSGFFGQVDDHTDIGPFTMVLVTPLGRQKLKTGRVEIVLSRPIRGTDLVIPDDTWRFSFFLDLFFADGGHLFAKENEVVLNILSPNSRSFSIE